MTLPIVVVCEADADFRLASTLADRVLCERVEWIEPELLPHLRSYCGVSDTESFLRWDRADDEARVRKIRVHGGFPDGPAELEAKMVRRAIRLVHFVRGDDVAIVLIRDDDNEPQRQFGFDQARRHSKNPDRVIIGIARTKRECWVLCGFDPRDDIERDSLQAERQLLGFDPREQAERLTAKHDQDKLSAKRVVSVLTKDNRSREVACWERADINSLRSRGKNTGLASYIDEIEQRLIPLIAMNPPA